MHTSGSRRVVAMFSLSMGFLRTEPRTEDFITGTSVLINLLSSRIYRRMPGSILSSKATVAVDMKQRRGGALIVADWEGHHHRWRSTTSYGARSGGWPPAYSVKPLDLLAEWRSTIFLPAAMPCGRQPVFYASSVARCNGGSVVPSVDVPGNGEAELTRKRIRIQSHFSFAFRGPLCKSRGLVGYFQFVRGPCVRCSVLRVSE